MYLFFKTFHSYFAFLLLAVLVLVIAVGMYGWLAKKPFTKINRHFALAGMIATHTQIAIGFVLYFLSPFGFNNFSAEAMKSSFTRLMIVEHPFTMLLAMVLVTIGFIRVKKATDATKKHKNMVLFYSIGLVFILSRIPWQLWF